MAASPARICAVALASLAFAAPSAAAIVPGGRVGGMKLVRAAWSEHGPTIFPACDPLITHPGIYHRSCTVPRTRRLFIGYGDFRPTFPALERAWRSEQWQLYVDGHEVYLPAFGTELRVLFRFPPGAYRDTVLREWKVMLLRPTPGRHTIRYITLFGDDTVTDVTFTVRVT